MFSERDLIFLSPDHTLSDLEPSSLQRNIWILSLREATSPDARDFLAKILLAVQRDLHRDAFFYEVEGSGPLAVVAAFRVHRPAQVLVFGFQPQQIGLRIQAKPYQALEFQGVQWLFSESLAVLEPDKTKKGLLWGALKGMFA